MRPRPPRLACDGREVGVLEQRVGGGAVLGVDGDADARPHRTSWLPMRVGLAERLEDGAPATRWPLPDPRGSAAARRTRRPRGAPRGRGEPPLSSATRDSTPRHVLEDAVAEGVAEHLVHAAEAVEADVQERDEPALLARLGHRLARPLEQQRARREPGERVDGSLPPQLALRLAR